MLFSPGMIPAGQRPVVSILMATRDNLPTLPRALATFLESPIDLEIVIVNDGSTDGTRAYLDSLPPERVRPIHLEKSQGLTLSLNQAFAVSRGEYLARQDADDASHPDRLQFQLKAFREDPALDILGTGNRILDEEGEVLAEVVGHNYGNALKRLRAGNFFCHGSLMLRRSAMERLGAYRPFFRYSQDLDLLLRAAAMGLKMRNLIPCLYDWTLSEKAISRSKSREQGLFAKTAKSASRDADLDLATCYARLETESAADEAASGPIPRDWQIMEILLLCGDTAGARRKYAELRERGAPMPKPGFAVRMRVLPSWLYRAVRILADLRYA